jgi:hypothetical protein
MEAGVETKFQVADDRSLMMGQRLYVPNNETVKRMVLQEAHESKFSIHSGSTKMYRDLKHLYYKGMRDHYNHYKFQNGSGR